MCRADINPAAESVLVGVLAHMAAALRDQHGLPPDAPIVIEEDPDA